MLSDRSTAATSVEPIARQARGEARRRRARAPGSRTRRCAAAPARRPAGCAPQDEQRPRRRAAAGCRGPRRADAERSRMGEEIAEARRFHHAPPPRRDPLEQHQRRGERRTASAPIPCGGAPARPRGIAPRRCGETVDCGARPMSDSSGSMKLAKTRTRGAVGGDAVLAGVARHRAAPTLRRAAPIRAGADRRCGAAASGR